MIVAGDIPTGFFTFGYFAMKHLVVKAYKGLQHLFANLLLMQCRDNAA